MYECIWHLIVDVVLICSCPVFVLSGFSDSEVAVLTPDAADLLDRLDLSMSSIDMTNTSLTMHEEKDGDVSGVGKLGQQHFITVLESVHLAKGI